MFHWRVAFLCVFAAVSAAADPVQYATFPEVARSRSPSRIVSGWEAEEGQIPFQLSLRMVNPTGTVSSCGGTIIHPEWGMTAAHCTAGRVTMVLRAGAVNLTRPEVLFETSEYYNHPNYNDNLPSVVQPNDISLLRFGRRLVFSERINQVRLQRSEDRNRNYDGERLIASGWGRTWTDSASPENMNWVYLSGVSNLDCWLAFSGSSIIVDSTICARGYNVSSQSTCQGDSGGPLTVQDYDGEITQIGISSFVSSAGCHVDVPAGFCRPGHYHDWFYQVTGINFDWYPTPPTTEEPGEVPTTVGTPPPETEGPEVPTTVGTPPPETEGPEVPTTVGTPPPETEGPEVPTTVGTPPPETEGPEVPTTVGTPPPETDGPEVPSTVGTPPPETEGPEVPTTVGPPSTEGPEEVPTTVGPPSTEGPEEVPTTVGPPSTEGPEEVPTTVGTPPPETEGPEVPSTVGPPSTEGPEEVPTTVGPPSTERPEEVPTTVGPPSTEGPEEVPTTVGPPSTEGPEEVPTTVGPPPPETEGPEVPTTVGPPSTEVPEEVPTTVGPPSTEGPEEVPTTVGPPSTEGPEEVPTTVGPPSTEGPEEVPTTVGPPSTEEPGLTPEVPSTVGPVDPTTPRPETPETVGPIDTTTQWLGQVVVVQNSKVTLEDDGDFKQGIFHFARKFWYW